MFGYQAIMLSRAEVYSFFGSDCKARFRADLVTRCVGQGIQDLN